MKNIMLLTTLIFLLSACRKKSDITITAYNYALAEPIANAEVIIVESSYSGNIFSASVKCKQIASATTDANGQCVFNDLKLKKNGSQQYAAKIKYSYGKSDFYNCNVTDNSKISLGNNNLILNSSDYNAYLRVQYYNTLNPSISGDSLIVSIASPRYTVPGQPFPFGGGGVFVGWLFHDHPMYPFNSSILTTSEKTNAGKNVLRIRKRKMGVVTTSIDTIKIYPYETKIIEINW